MAYASMMTKLVQPLTEQAFQLIVWIRLWNLKFLFLELNTSCTKTKM